MAVCCRLSPLSSLKDSVPPRKVVATAAAPFWRRSARVSALVAFAYWAACAALPSLIISIVMGGTGFPCAIALTSPATDLWLVAT